MKRLIILSSLLIALFSCTKESNQLDGGYGYVSFNFSEDKTIITKGDEAVFAVDILNEQGVAVKSYTDHRELETEPLKLAAGKYVVNATSGVKTECGFDKPFYAGADTIEVTKGRTAQCNVVCTLANVKVAVTLGSDVTDNFREISLTVSNKNENGSLIFSNINGTISKNGYFTCTGSLEWKLYLVNNNGVIFENDLTGVINNVKPREFYNLKFKVGESEDKPAVDIVVDVDETTNETVHNIDVNLGKQAKPLMAGSSFDITKEQYVSSGVSAEWNVGATVACGIKRFKIMHNSLALSNAGIPYEQDLVTADASLVSKMNAAGLTWTGVENGKTSATIQLGGLLKNLPDGVYSIVFDILDLQQQTGKATFNFTVGPATLTSTKSADPWAKHATLNAVWNVMEQPSNIGFEYKKESDNSWTKVTDVTVNAAQKAFSIVVTDLVPSTKYNCRAFAGDEVSNEVSFTTEAAEQIPNMSFDTWTATGGYKSSWYANSVTDKTSSDFWWDSGNAGANMLKSVNPTSPTDVVAVSGDGKKAAQLKTEAVVGVLAAGNLYLGRFGKTIGTSGAEIYFGQPYTCRPQYLSGYYSYSPKPIGNAKDPYKDLLGQNDICSIYVVLTKWPDRFTVNTSNKQFIDIENDPDIIAYGVLEDNTDTGGYKKFNIKLDYRNTTDKPTYCVIVASASKYGDYFTGGVGSILLIDEFEFIF